MSDTLAYHTVVHALEAKSGWTPVRQFAASVKHALNGHVPHQRHIDAGLACIRRGMGEDQIERLVSELFTFDLNPIGVVVRSIIQPTQFVTGFNAYNKTVSVGVRTTVEQVGAPSRQVVISRDAFAVRDDLAPCRHATHALFHLALQQVMENKRSRSVQPLRRLSEVAQFLGLENSVMYEASLTLETLGHIPIPDLAKALGCHPRTLERRMREDELTPEMLRQAVRLIRALEGIRICGSLAEVVIDAGFYDQAHMTRAFHASSGMPPSFFQKLMSREAVPA